MTTALADTARAEPDKKRNDKIDGLLERLLPTTRTEHTDTGFSCTANFPFPTIPVVVVVVTHRRDTGRARGRKTAVHLLGDAMIYSQLRDGLLSAGDVPSFADTND